MRRQAARDGNRRPRSGLIQTGMPLSETQVIELLQSAGATRTDVCAGIGDDAAVLELGEGQQLISCVDAIVEGVHFPRDISATDIGWRALAVNLSDFAAMGAVPRWATLVLALPEAEEEWVRGFAQGFAEIAALHQVALVGGDTVRGQRMAAVQVMGTAKAGDSIMRSGANTGDDVWVSGTLGDAAAGLAVLQGELAVDNSHAGELIQKFLRPEPRLQLGQSLTRLASAAIDISDGLLTDAARLARASGVGMQLEIDRLPLSEVLGSATSHAQALNFAATGGDDYELLFTSPASRRDAIRTLIDEVNMSCTRIGSVLGGQTVTCVLESKPWIPSHTGFDHFALRGSS